jgi:hypothetical protein
MRWLGVCRACVRACVRGRGDARVAGGWYLWWCVGLLWLVAWFGCHCAGVQVGWCTGALLESNCHFRLPQRDKREDCGRFPLHRRAQAFAIRPRRKEHEPFANF